MKTLIFDNNAGHLQWISTREIYLEALEEFDAAVHIGPHNRGKPADWAFYRVPDEKAREIADWHEHGSPGAFGPRIWLQTWAGSYHVPARPTPPMSEQCDTIQPREGCSPAFAYP